MGFSLGRLLAAFAGLSKEAGPSTGAGLSFGGFAPPTPAAPVNVVAPVVSGSPQVGETLTTTNGSWSAYPSPTFTYQWRADRVDIVGETNNTLLLTSGELGALIDCVVTATNSQGAASQASNQVGPVVVPPLMTLYSLKPATRCCSRAAIAYCLRPDDG